MSQTETALAEAAEVAAAAASSHSPSSNSSPADRIMRMRRATVRADLRRAIRHLMERAVSPERMSVLNRLALLQTPAGPAA